MRKAVQITLSVIVDCGNGKLSPERLARKAEKTAIGEVLRTIDTARERDETYIKWCGQIRAQALE